MKNQTKSDIGLFIMIITILIMILSSYLFTNILKENTVVYAFFSFSLLMIPIFVYGGHLFSKYDTYGESLDI
jgi:hypothetical protein